MADQVIHTLGIVVPRDDSVRCQHGDRIDIWVYNGNSPIRINVSRVAEQSNRVFYRRGRERHSPKRKQFRDRRKEFVVFLPDIRPRITPHRGKEIYVLPQYKLTYDEDGYCVKKEKCRIPDDIAVKLMELNK